jgi:hypothetical protein
MKKVILLFMSILFFSCEEINDDTNIVCTENCTHIEGQILTKDQLPVKNVELIVSFQKSTGTYSNYIRKIAKAKTDVNGYYNMDFYLKDEELGESFGGLEIYMKQNTIASKYFYPNRFNLFEVLNINDRNISLTKNIYLPTKKDIKVKLQNFIPNQNGDYFEVQLYVPCGFENSEISSITGNYHKYVTKGINFYRLNSPSQIFTIDAALDEINYLVLVRMKNGVYTEETIPVSVDENSNTVLTYDY